MQKGRGMWGRGAIKVSSASHCGKFSLMHMVPPYLQYRQSDHSHGWTPLAHHWWMWGCSGGGGSRVWGMIRWSWDCWAISTRWFQFHLEEGAATCSRNWEDDAPKASKEIWQQIQENTNAMGAVPRGPCKAGLPLGVRVYGTCWGENQEKGMDGTACGNGSRRWASIRGECTRGDGHQRFGVRMCEPGASEKKAVDISKLMDKTSP